KAPATKAAPETASSATAEETSDSKGGSE
ncbi:MAG: hypothetical protein JWR13_705, partial [Mycobacterium sp.]|nr:hypothetical protein [Mycobacterium sp.]